MASLPEMIHGQKPKVAPFIPTDPLEELNKLISGEVSSWDQITQLSDLYQNYMLDAYQNAGLDLSGLIGTGSQATQATLDRANQFLTGELPPDIMGNVFRQSAFQNLQSGLLGSPGGSANQARQLGLTSLDLINQGANLATSGGNAAQRWQQIASGTILPPSSQLYSPEWFTQFMAEQNAAKQATKQYKYNVAAAPDPVISGIAGTVMNLVGAYLGHGMGGGGNTLATTQPATWSGNVSQGVGYGQPAAPAAAPASDYKNVVTPGAVNNTVSMPTAYIPTDYFNNLI